MKIETVRKRIQQRREVLAKFNALPASERAALTMQGRNPYDTIAERERKRAAWNMEQRRKFDRLPKDTRDKITDLGLSPYQEPDAIQYRATGKITAQ